MKFNKLSSVILALFLVYSLLVPEIQNRIPVLALPTGFDSS